MKRRIFVAVGISEKLQSQISAWQKNWQQLKVRWVKKENLHITLIQPWYTNNISEIEGNLKLSKNLVEPFSLTFQQITFGPSANRPGLIWAEGEKSLGLELLKNKLEKILQQKGEKRDYTLHMTLARFNPKDFSNFPIRTLNEKVNWEEKIDRFFLMESHLKKSGATYDRIAEIPL
ncbi:MAG: RNA 2',3'-cyclic phosphodiesterase [Nanoarchaeota archaeon]